MCDIKLKKDIINKEKGFIVQVLFVIFFYLEKVSLFSFIRSIAAHKNEINKDNNKKENFVSTHMFSEIWAIGNLLFAGLISINLIKHTKCIILVYILLIYSIARVFELLVYQINVMFFHRLNEVYRDIPKKDNKQQEEYAILSATRTVILLIFNIIEYIVQFTVIFEAFKVIYGITTIDVGVLQSFELFMSLADIEIYSNYNCMFVIAYVEVLIGVFMNLLCLARFVGLLPNVKTKTDI